MLSDHNDAFPQPAPGAAPSPGPMKVADDRLRSLLGVTDVTFKRGQQRSRSSTSRCRGERDIMTTRIRNIRIAIALTVVLAVAAGFPATSAQAIEQVKIDDFAFAPQHITVKAGTTVTWINDDDIPHTVASSTKLFRSKTLDTEDKFSFSFTTPGSYEYFCSLHPHMTGAIVVEAATGSSAAQ
jgi:plastocyanin